MSLPADFDGNSLSRSGLLYLFNHVFLPPKLPEGDDSSPDHDKLMIGAVQSCLTGFAEMASGLDTDGILQACDTMSALRSLRDCRGDLHEDSLREALRDISLPGCKSTISVQITKQNAGLIIRRVEDGAVFEMFELSPNNSSVLTTRGRLIRLFPAVAVKVHSDVLVDPEFQSSIAKTMAKMSHQRVPETVPKVRKAKQSHEEERETASSKAVTELLASILLGFGEKTSVQAIRKHTREEVLWKNSKLPWRRSPTWLLVRVTLQLSLQRLASSDKETYKKFMVYFLAHVLEAARAQSLDSDILHTMSAKIVRRLSKLRHSDSGPWMAPIRRAMEQTSQLLDERWRSIRQTVETPIDLSVLSRLDPDRDVHLHLPALDDFLFSILRRTKSSDHEDVFPESQIQSLSRSSLPCITSGFSHEYKPFQLAAIESWVEMDLDAWVPDNTEGPETCDRLAEFLVEYHKHAADCYAGSPEDISRMLLTILEIWIAMDKSAVRIIPLMLQYSPQIPMRLYQGLLLGRMQDMNRLHRAEEYLLSREQSANHLHRPSILSSFGTEGSFSARYFDGSTSHQDLLRRIEAQAAIDKHNKKEEWRSLKAEYYRLMDLHATSICEYYSRTNFYGDTISEHSSSCARCRYSRDAENLSITVHEWPLPMDSFEAKSTVFELDPPPVFQPWRDATIYFIVDVLGYNHSPGEEPRFERYPLASYGGLSRWQYACTKQRIYLLSEVKSHHNTHRRDKLIVNLREEEVCVNNGLQLRYYDAERGTFMSDFSPTDSTLEQCTLALPSRSIELTPFILRTHDRPNGKTPNEVLAEQHLCPSHLSLGEGEALMSLSYGDEIRWLGLLTQLASPQLDFVKPETATFLLQICLQAGPNTVRKPCRDSHTVLVEERFAFALLKELNNRIRQIEKNPEAFVALWSFTVLGAKGLAMTGGLRDEFLEFMGRCRNISYQWVKLLHEKCREADDEEQRGQFRDLMFDIALVCVDSFNVDQAHLKIILDSPDAASTLVEMSIHIRDNVELRKTNQQDPLQSLLFHRWQVLMHRSSPTVKEHTLQHEKEGLDMAIKRCWPAFSRDGDWQSVSSAEYWLESRSSSYQVLYNTLLGELLVGGRPHSRLPASYKQHPLYVPLFGRCAIDVRPPPSGLAGMAFLGQGTFCGHQVHFGMQTIHDGTTEDFELLLATQHQGSTHDLVPSRVFDGGLPEILAKRFVHWYDHGTGEIEFRHLSTPWTTDPGGWRLKKHGDMWTLSTCTGSHLMVSPCSDTARRIAAIFAPLDTVMHMHILYNQQTRQIEIQLPRLKLDFYLHNAREDCHLVRSHQFQGMQIDTDQSIGTLVGLRNKFVLQGSEKSDDRLVLIPERNIRFSRSLSGHVDVSGAYGTASVSPVHCYWIDAQLGRLKDNGTLQSKLFLSYLHALTSHCIPDPFTMHTGTEQALSILESAAVRSSNTLTEDNARLLTQLAQLTPGREFYPSHLKEMQSVTWCDALSYLSQPSQFYTVTQHIIQHVQRVSFLYSNSDETRVEINHAHPDLVEREAIREASLYVAGSLANAFTMKHDKIYDPRDRGQKSERALRATQIATKVSNRSQSLEFSPCGDLVGKLYKFLGDSSGTLPPRQLELHEIDYDSKWLADPEGFLPGLWCTLHHAFGHSTRMSRFQTATWLASLAYSNSECPDVQDITQVAYAFANISHVTAVALPVADEYDLAQGYELDRLLLSSIIRNHEKHYYQSPESNLSRRRGETNREWHIRREREFRAQMNVALECFKEHLAPQWPCLEPRSTTGTMESTYFNVQGAMTAITSKWRAWYQNLLFRGYLENIVAAMKEAVVNPVNIPNFQPPAEPPVLQHQQARVTVDDIFQFHGPLSTTVSRPALDITLRTVKERRNGHELNEVLDCLGAKVCSEYQSRYLEDLRSSNLSLNEEERREVLDRPLLSLRTLLVKYQRQCVIRAEQIYEFMVQDTGHAVLAAESDLGTSSVLEEMQAIAHFAGWWPRTSRSFFLSQLQRVRWTRLPEVWKRRVIEYGLAITDLQRADRLLHACGNEADLVKEICNVGHQNWDPFSSPEWLLMECESGILIRHVQQSIAQLMMVPPNSENATMQLNMGEGKSSVIVPMIAAALADGSRLVRVIVTKPQFKQMHQILVLKLAGMLGRRIYHLPISRNIRLDGSEVSKIWRIILECQKYGGVLLVQPEHLLSFQLMGLEQQISMSNGIGHKLLRIQTWLDNNSRDIIDESDENFSVKFELVYTIGQQRPIEHSPKRWTIIQQVLGLVKEISHEISKQSPKSVELSGHGETSRFPRIRILDAFGSEELLKRLAERICSEGLDGFPISRQPEGRRRAVQRYISKSLLSEAEINAVEKSAFWRDSVINTLLMLRGLVAQGIIAFSLGQKRWRVNYGIDYNRDPRTRLAVPFRAKDDPAPRAEFSHPDVAIVLTCLSYYYSGLNIEELLESFERLKQDDQAQSEYSLWTATASHLPPAFRELVGINLRDKVQFSTEVFPHLRYSKGAIDYFLSKTVFAREMKEFPKKLSTSGWDLAKIKKHPTTGFSGTNDSRYILPLNVTQLDQAEQRHTNALVLCYLLQPENSTFLVPKHDFTSEADVSDGKTFLQTVSNFDQETRVILDVGAQLIDLTNRQVSEAWLEVTQHRSGAAEAVIFFDEEDVLSVLDRSGHSQPFQTSHHAHQTDKCLVFLDEAHTRGTDLKLPEKYRAAVTLGANLTKDRLLQACMRMRRLGHGQSVVFCVPQEIKNKIIQLNNDNVRDYSKVTVSDVVKWAISETTDDTRKSIPLWITQALRFGKHSELWRQYSAGPVEDLTRWSKDFREDEAQSLEQRYRPSIVRGNPLETNLDVEESFKQRISDHCRIFGPINFHAADLQEEQERELSPEAEEERQVERPPAAEPERHKIHENVQHFVQHGYFQDGNRGIRSAFSTLDTTSAAKHLDPKEFPAHLWVTGDFARTVKLDFSSEDQSDFFQRSVSWILTSTKRAGELFIISPYEAQQLLPAIKSSNYVTLHLYAPRMNMGQQPLDHLALYTVPERRVAALPPMLSSLLNVFAGQLYMRSFEEYTSICKLLGLAWQSVGDIEIEADGFIPRRGATTAQLINQTQFTRSPTKFLQDFMTKVRRNNESIEKTHMGRLLNGEILCRDGFKLGTGANQPGVESLSAEVSRLKIVTLE